MNKYTKKMSAEGASPCLSGPAAKGALPARMTEERKGRDPETAVTLLSPTRRDPGAP